MNIVRSRTQSRTYYHNFLLGIAAIFVMGCNEPSPPTPKTLLAKPAPSSTTPGTVLSKHADGQKQKPQNMVLRNLDSEKIRRGKIIYQTNCVVCHGKNAESTPDWRKQGTDGKYPPPPLNGSAHTWHHSTETLSKVIREGSPPGLGGMPAWGKKLTDEEIDDVIVWITSIWPDEIYDIWYKEIEQRQQKARQHKLD